MNQFRHTQIIKELAVQHGFDFCGIAEAKELEQDVLNLFVESDLVILT